GGGGANSSRSSRNNADAAMGVILSCSHGFCFLCISKYVNVEIQGDNIKFPILCPVKSATCQKDGISEGIIEQALSREDLEKYYRKMAEMAIGDKKVSPWHNGFTCKEYQALPADQRSPEDLDVINLVKKEGWKRCPRCNFLIQKNGGCNHMTCKCKAQFAIDYSAFNDEFPPLENSDLNNNIINGGSSFEEEETEFIKHWREEQREVIARRDEESEEKKQETINKAREDIDKFYDEYNEKKARSHEENKDDITSGTAWGRICKQVDLSTAQSKSGSKHVKDVSRFKELLLSLKRDENAPGSGGY
ncbi:5824_t:CDS:2, partial [Entrophospora sp. SA101]